MKKLLFAALIFIATIGASAQPKLASARFNKTAGKDGESFKSFTFNGSWSWFSDPRAIYHEREFKKTYSGWVDNYGNIVVGSYDHDTKEVDTHIVMENLEVNDNVNPSLLFDKEGKLLIFFNRYEDNSESNPIYLAKAEKVEDIHSWGKVNTLDLNDLTNTKGISTHKYTNPIKLKKEDGKIFLFWTGVDGKPSISTSKDSGDTWSKGKIVFTSEPTKYPYSKIYSNGDSKIHFTFTDGDPKDEKNNSIYYTYYQDGAFYKADGTKIKTVDQLPLVASELDIVHNAKNGGDKALNWDVAEDKDGNPVVAYATFPTDAQHYYCYAKWDGKKWLNRTVADAGSWFPKTVEGKKESNPHYSGGMSLDHENPNVVYLSIRRDSVLEIEKWTTKNSGKSWSVTKITSGSEKDNIRPFAIRGAEEGNPIQVLWMQNSKYIVDSYSSSTEISWVDRFQSAIKIGTQSTTISDPLEPSQIKDVMRQTADWQFANPYDLNRLNDWHWGTYYVGMQALYELTAEDRYKQELINIGEQGNWKLNNQILYADMLTVVSNWAWLYGLEKDPKMIENSRWALDVHLSTRRSYHVDVTFAGNPYFAEWWTWCDALFVAPTSFARMSKETGDQRYLKYADEMYWITTDYLYSDEDSLMFRDDRYFEKKSDNNTKIFWGRGNGWVIASISRMLDLMPEDYPTRGKYEARFKEMAERLIDLQGDDDMWRVSLLDPEYQDEGEVSGSAFYVFALAWGLNNDLLDEKYRDDVERGWIALCKNVNRNGRLGNVQSEGIDPRNFTEDDWAVYGTGAFLMAGREMYKLETTK